MLKKFGLPVLVIVGVVIAIIFLSRGGSKEVTTSSGEKIQTGISGQASPTDIGQKAPDFTLVDFSGNEVKLSQYAGKPVFIDFWAGWCPFCLGEMKEIEKIHKEFGPPAGGNLVVLGIHRTETESKEIGDRFQKQEVGGVTYPLLRDTNGDVYKAYARGNFMPMAIFIDKNGIIQDRKAGPKTAEEMRTKVEKLLSL